MAHRIMSNRFVCSISLVAVFATFPSSAAAQWQKRHSLTREYREYGELLPGGGIILGKYYAGKMNVFKGRDPNEIVVQAEIHSAVGTYTESESQKRPETGYVHCMFFRDELTPANSHSRERELMFLPDSTQASHEIPGSGTVTIEVPREAAFVILTLSQNRTSSSSSLERDANSYWSDQLLLRECGVAPLYGKYHELWLYNPARKTAAPRQPVERRQPAMAGKLVVHVDCPKCDGTGTIRVPDEKKECSKCGGTGYVYRKFGAGMKKREKCAGIYGQCGGDGYITIPAHTGKCTQCGGSGKIAASRSEARRLHADRPTERMRLSMGPQLGTARAEVDASRKKLTLAATGLTNVTAGKFRHLPEDLPVVRIELYQGSTRLSSRNLSAKSFVSRSGGTKTQGTITLQAGSSALRVVFKPIWTKGRDPTLDAVEFEIHSDGGQP